MQALSCCCWLPHSPRKRTHIAPKCQIEGSKFSFGSVFLGMRLLHNYYSHVPLKYPWHIYHRY